MGVDFDDDPVAVEEELAGRPDKLFFLPDKLLFGPDNPFSDPNKSIS